MFSEIPTYPATEVTPDLAVGSTREDVTESDRKSENLGELTVASHQETRRSTEPVGLSISELLAQTYSGDPQSSRLFIQALREDFQQRVPSADPEEIARLAEAYGEKMIMDERRSSVNEMTGLLNQDAFRVRARAFCERMEREGRPFTILRIDLNGFKGINDKYGHAAGDEYLRQVGLILKETVTEDVNTLLGRPGGDEFAVVLGDRRAEEGREVSARINEALHQRKFTVQLPDKEGIPQDQVIHIRQASIGQATWSPEAGFPAGDTEQAADLDAIAVKREFYRQNPQYQVRVHDLEKIGDKLRLMEEQGLASEELTRSLVDYFEFLYHKYALQHLPSGQGPV
jgi:diguanylate cyclase (GGDEF)-like protein